MIFVMKASVEQIDRRIARVRATLKVLRAERRVAVLRAAQKKGGPPASQGTTLPGRRR